MKNLKIGKKLLLSFGIVVLLIILLGSSALFGLSRMDSVVSQYSEHTVPDTENIWQIRRNLLSVERYMLRTIAAPTAKESQELILETGAEAKVLVDSMKTYRGNMRTDAALLDAAEAYWAQADAIRIEIEQIAKHGEADTNEQAYEMYVSQFLPITDQLNEKVLEIASGVETMSVQQDADAGATTTMILILILVILATSIALSIIMGMLIQKSIATPVKEIERAMSALTGGELEKANVSYRSRDELGALSENMRNLTERLRNIIKEVGELLGEMGHGNFQVESKMEENYVGSYGNILAAMRTIRENLSDTLSQINMSSDQVSSGSDQVSSGAQALSQGATEQASSVEELAASITEISHQIEGTAQGARDAAQTVGSVAVEINASNEHMQQLIVAMGEISQKSGEISKIIKTIEDIAFQTNILALNAAVEAARAGAAGKGFAVVADEVRNLASKSAEAAKNTTALIEGTIQAVGAGTKIADETANRLTQVVTGAQEVVTIVQRIDGAASEQAMAIAQVTAGVDQISAVVQTNSATAEESAAASEELSGQANMLKSLVGRFKLLGSQTSSLPVSVEEHSYSHNDHLFTGGGKY